jgi:hypothetical protein
MSETADTCKTMLIMVVSIACLVMLCVIIGLLLNIKPADPPKVSPFKKDTSDDLDQNAGADATEKSDDGFENISVESFFKDSQRPLSEYFEKKVPDIFNTESEKDDAFDKIVLKEDVSTTEHFENDEYIMYNCVPKNEKQVIFDDTHHVTENMICEKIKYSSDMITEGVEYQIYTEYDGKKIYLNHFLSNSCNEFIHLSPIPSIWKVGIFGDNEVLMSSDKFVLVPSRLENPNDSMNAKSVEFSASCSSVNANTVIVDKEMFKDDSVQENILMISPESDNCGNDLIKDSGWILSRTLVADSNQINTVIKENDDLYIFRENSKLILNKCPSEKSYIYETFNSVVNYKHIKKSSVDVSIVSMKDASGNYSKWRFEKFNREKTKYEPEYVKSHIIEQMCLV